MTTQSLLSTPDHRNRAKIMTTHSRSTAKSTLVAAFFTLLAMTAVSSAQSTDATLSSLVPSAGTLHPAFASGTITYTATVPYATTEHDRDAHGGGPHRDRSR